MSQLRGGESSDEDSPPRKHKKRIAHRQQHVAGQWQGNWTKYHLQPCKKGKTFAFYIVCNCDFSVAGGGVHKVKHHCSSQKHMAGLRVVGQQRSLSDLFVSSTSKPSIRDQVTTVELYFTTFLIKHNLPLSSEDHFVKRCLQTVRSKKSTRVHGQ